MTEALFYQLERRPLTDILPGLIEKSLQRGWRAVIKTESAERSAMLDNLLWAYDEASFLAHARSGDGDPKRQPVLITVEDENPNDARVLFCVGGTEPQDWQNLAAFARVVLLFDGRDSYALGQARAAWKKAGESGHDVTYWKEQPSGKFEKQS
ncbi:MAG: DNA polymerase III subunit chi [Rhizomicrobium sp.]